MLLSRKRCVSRTDRDRCSHLTAAARSTVLLTLAWDEGRACRTSARGSPRRTPAFRPEREPQPGQCLCLRRARTTGRSLSGQCERAPFDGHLDHSVVETGATRELRLLLVPGLSAPHVHPSTDEWSSSRGVACSPFRETFASNVRERQGGVGGSPKNCPAGRRLAETAVCGIPRMTEATLAGRVFANAFTGSRFWCPRYS